MEARHQRRVQPSSWLEVVLKTAGRKIRDNEMKRIPYMLIVGEKEAENGEVSVRRQGEGDKGTMKFEEFAKILNEEVQNMINKW